MRKLSDNIIAPSLLIFLLISFYAINNYIWLQANLIPPFWDEARHLTTTLKYLDSIRHSSNILAGILQVDSFYPPLFYLFSLPVGLLWGISLNELAMTNIIFLFILLFSVYKIGELFFDRNTGLLATFIVSMFPMVFGTSRMFLLDFPLTAMVALSIYLLIATEYFNNRKFSILFGLSLGLGMLTKEAFFIFLIGPITYTLYRAITLKPNSAMRRIIINFILSFAIAVAIALSFYLKHVTNYLSILFLQFKMPAYFNKTILHMLPLFIITIMLALIFKFKLLGRLFKTTALLIILILLVGLYWHSKETLGKYTWYAFSLKDQIGLPFLVLFLISLPYFLFYQKNKAFLFLWLALPYFFFTFFYFVGKFPYWQFRYTLPYLPVIALISAKSLLAIRNKIQRILITCLMIVLAFLNFFNISYGIPIINNYSKNKVVHTLIEPEGTNWWLMHRPVREDWKIPEILKWIEKDKAKEKITVNLLCDTDEINIWTFSYYILANQLHFQVMGEMNPGEFDSEYIIILSNPICWNWFFKEKQILRLFENFKEYSHNYILVKDFNTPNGILYIYKKK